MKHLQIHWLSFVNHHSLRNTAKRFPNLNLFLSIALCLCVYTPTIAQTNLSSSNLPLVLIDTDEQEIEDETRIIAEMQIIYNGIGLLTSIGDSANVYDGRISIETRGSSSQFYPKKSFGLETQLPNGENNNVSLLGMPKENDWILYAPFSDKSLLRNVLAYQIANDMGRYAARTQFCELFINGNYEGVYVLMEKLKRDKNRIDIANLSTDEIAGDDLTGGYIIKIDKLTGSGGSGWTSEYPPSYNLFREILFQYEYPESEGITDEQAAYIEGFVRDFEDYLQREDFEVSDDNPYFDVDSFIDYMIVNEVCKNIDAFRLSTFLYKDKDSNGGKLQIGPVWDFNFSLGNVNYCLGGLSTGWVLDFNQICTNDSYLIPFWWEKLRQSNVFNERVYERWQELRSTVLETNQLLLWIEEQSLYLEEAQTRNFAKWDILNIEVWPNNYVGGNYLSEVVYLKNWLRARLTWLDTAFKELTLPKQEDILGFEAVKITPNPFNQFPQWTYRAVKGDFIEVILFDMMGKSIGKWAIECEQTGQNTLSLEEVNPHLSKGLYHYRFDINGREVKREVILKY
ncbi:MAG: CotH kinase family protein [Chitinophagales bacterium]